MRYFIKGHNLSTYHKRQHAPLTLLLTFLPYIGFKYAVLQISNTQIETSLDYHLLPGVILSPADPQLQLVLQVEGINLISGIPCTFITIVQPNRTRMLQCHNIYAIIRNVTPKSYHTMFYFIFILFQFFLHYLTALIHIDQRAE